MNDPVSPAVAGQNESPRQAAMWAATKATRQILAAAKNPRTLLGRMPPTSVAFHAAYAAVKAFEESMREASGE